MPREISHEQLDAGIMQHVPGFRVPEGFTPDAANVEISAEGKILIPRRGAERWTSSPLQSGKRLDGLWQLRRGDGSWVILAACAGKLYTVDATAAVTDLGASLSTPRRNWSARGYADKLYIFNGVDEPRVYDTELTAMSSVEDMALPATWRSGNWPGRVALINAGYNERLAVWGLRDNPSYVYFSGLRDPLDWDWTATESSALRIPVRENDGEAVVAVLDFGDLLLVMKETKTVAYRNLDYLSNTVEEMTVLPYGCGSADSIVRWENGAAWWGRWDGGHGPMAIGSTNEALEIRGDLMTQRIKVALADVDESQLDSITVRWDADLQQVCWHAPSRRDTKSNLLFSLYPYRRYKDKTGRTLGAFHVGSGLDATCILSLPRGGSPLVLAGDSSGYINRLGFGHTDLGVDIDSHYSFPSTISAGELRVTLLDVLTAEGGASLRAEASWDEGDPEIVAGSLAPNLGDDRTSRHWPTGSGRRFRVTVRHTGGSVGAELEAAVLRLDMMRSR